MKIIRLPHDKANKAQLFGLIGEFCASADVRKALGGPISSDQSHVWFVAVEDGSVRGFVAMIPLKSEPKARMAHLYTEPDKHQNATENKLMAACEKEALGLDITELHTIDYGRREKFYHIHGWAKSGERGQFSTYTKRITHEPGKTA